VSPKKTTINIYNELNCSQALRISVMALNQKDIDDLKESFDYLVKRNEEIQDNVKIAIRSIDYLKAVKAIDSYVRIVDDFIINALNMAQKYSNKANNKNAFICSYIIEMAEEIKTAHLKVERIILKKYIRKIN
jgi:hypothetical protein